jgi:hypothetical protein
MQVVVRYSKLDRKTKILRFPNSWHYILSGEIVDLDSYGVAQLQLETVGGKPLVPRLEGGDQPVTKYRRPSEFVGYKIFDVLVDVSSTAWLYTGQLVDWGIKADGQVSFVVLRDAVRMKVSEFDRYVKEHAEYVDKERIRDEKIARIPKGQPILLPENTVPKEPDVSRFDTHALTITADEILNYNVRYYAKVKIDPRFKFFRFVGHFYPPILFLIFISLFSIFDTDILDWFKNFASVADPSTESVQEICPPINSTQAPSAIIDC